MAHTAQAALRSCLHFATRRCLHRLLIPPPEFTLPDLEAMWEAQGGRCYLSGEPLALSGPMGVTIDRIDSRHGYQRDNVALATKRANQAKSDMTMAEFVQLCRQVIYAADTP
jgi:hypothetical protein